MLMSFVKTSIHTALVARVQDSNVSVLEALYAKPAQLVSVLLADVNTYVDTVAQVLHAPGPTPLGRAAVKAHLSFIIGHMYPSLTQANEPEHAAQILDRVLFPYLLFSKPRQKTAALVWELVEAGEQTQGSVGRSALLAGCVDAVRWEERKSSEGGKTADEDSYRNTEIMATINLALAAKIAGEPTSGLESMLEAF